MKVVATDWDLGTEGPARRLLERLGWEFAAIDCSSPEELIAAGQGARALMVRHVTFPREVFEALPDLEFISRLGIGPWGVDITAALDHRVAVADCPGYCTDEAVAHTLALLLALNRGLLFAKPTIDAGQWGSYRGRPNLSAPSDLILGLIGLGNMGQGLAAVAHGLGMDIIGYDPYVLGVPAGVEQVELDLLLAESDIVCLLCPALPDGRPLIDAAALAKMKPTAYLVNTARGSLVDEAALIDALDHGRLAGAALDALAVEPPPADHPLLHRDDVLVTPHVGYLSVQSQHELKVHGARNVVQYFSGEPLRGLLTPDFRRE